MRMPLYYDYACPWAYMGSCRAEAYFEPSGVEIDFRPIHLATLREAPATTKAPAAGERKSRWYASDIQAWSQMTGADLNTDARHLITRPTRLALQGALVAKDAGRFREYHYPAYRARWSEARDVSDRDVVRALLAGAGLEADAALAKAESAELEQRLDRETQDAIALGVFGVPTVVVGERLFWGNDRFELARFFVEKQQ
jgi:2-hydroxychromene-2-carboxylate isomerase